jgi:hypothetical protein
VTYIVTFMLNLEDKVNTKDRSHGNHVSGGTFALYSLICRYAKVSLIPNQQAEDTNVSNYKLELPNRRVRRASCLKSRLEKSNFAKIFLLFASMLGTAMVIGDGVLTPCISGLHIYSFLASLFLDLIINI